MNKVTSHNSVTLLSHVKSWCGLQSSIMSRAEKNTDPLQCFKLCNFLFTNTLYLTTYNPIIPSSFLLLNTHDVPAPVLGSKQTAGNTVPHLWGLHSTSRRPNFTCVYNQVGKSTSQRMNTVTYNLHEHRKIK